MLSTEIHQSIHQVYHETWNRCEKIELEFAPSYMRDTLGPSTVGLEMHGHEEVNHHALIKATHIGSTIR